jgi:hypothetical protein
MWWEVHDTANTGFEKLDLCVDFAFCSISALKEMEDFFV